MADADFRRKLLAGFLDTDGSVKKKNCIRFYTISPQLARDMQHLVGSLGGSSRIRIERKRNPKWQDIFNLTITFENFTIPMKVARKLDRVRTHRRNYSHCTISVKKSIQSMVYGFLLDSNSQWYVTDNWLVTHNCPKYDDEKLCSRWFPRGYEKKKDINIKRLTQENYNYRTKLRIEVAKELLNNPVYCTLKKKSEMTVFVRNMAPRFTNRVLTEKEIEEIVTITKMAQKEGDLLNEMERAVPPLVDLETGKPLGEGNDEAVEVDANGTDDGEETTQDDD
jgi:hypothetical protein